MFDLEMNGTTPSIGAQAALAIGDPDASVAPINTFHVGFWFDNPQDAEACGFDPTKPTPFNGEHRAGPDAMISVPDARTGLGPLCTHVSRIGVCSR